jgi:hypothetical protein
VAASLVFVVEAPSRRRGRHRRAVASARVGPDAIDDAIAATERASAATPSTRRRDAIDATQASSAPTTTAPRRSST